MISGRAARRHGQHQCLSAPAPEPLLDMGWLPTRILPKKKFPKIEHKEARAITWDEHCRIIQREGNPERRDFYELCWHFGGSQSDIAGLDADDLDYERRCFAYDRLKTGNMGGTQIGDKAWDVILRRPRQGPLFPYLITVREADRATEFKQRCEGLGIKGVTLHSYRYAWAERAADTGYPERYAQRALGQNSKIVHRAYAKKGAGPASVSRALRGGQPEGPRRREDCDAAARSGSAQGGLASTQPLLKFMKETKIHWCHSTVNWRWVAMDANCGLRLDGRNNTPPP